MYIIPTILVQMRVLIIIMLLNVTDLACAQARTGIYLTTHDDEETCENKFKLLNENRIYCLLQEPVLEPDSFESISAIVYDSLYNMRQFKIRLTPLGAKQINSIAEKLPQYKLGIVVDGILISALNLDGIYQARTIVIWDEFDSHSMDWIHKSLSKQVAGMYKKI